MFPGVLVAATAAIVSVIATVVLTTPVLFDVVVFVELMPSVTPQNDINIVPTIRYHYSVCNTTFV